MGLSSAVFFATISSTLLCRIPCAFKVTIRRVNIVADIEDRNVAHAFGGGEGFADFFEARRVRASRRMKPGHHDVDPRRGRSEMS
jgi:hypothetical protein